VGYYSIPRSRVTRGHHALKQYGVRELLFVLISYRIIFIIYRHGARGIRRSISLTDDIFLGGKIKYSCSRSVKTIAFKTNPWYIWMYPPPPPNYLSSYGPLCNILAPRMGMLLITLRNLSSTSQINDTSQFKVCELTATRLPISMFSLANLVFIGDCEAHALEQHSRFDTPV
jgi:hypothetical protein